MTIEQRHEELLDAMPGEYRGEVEGLRAVLSGLSSYLGAGLGDEATTPEQFDQRIRWGIEHQASAYRDRAASIVEECSKRPGTTWGEVKSAIQNDTFFPEPDNSEVERLRAEVDRLKAERDTPQVADFTEAVRLEAAHQRERWGSEHDAGKSPYDWFWLIGYLAQKAADAAVRGDIFKAQHHTISTAAALANWHTALGGGDDSMRPGIMPSDEAQARAALAGKGD